MNTQLTVTINNKKSKLIDLTKMRNALSFSKEDVSLYFFILSEIATRHTDRNIQTKAWKYLTKQNKLQNILKDLIIRLDILNKQWNVGISSEDFNYADICQQMNQLEEEIRLFHEMHYVVKRAYFCFVHEYFQENWNKQLRKVA